MSCVIKENNKPDLCLIAATPGNLFSSYGVFTKNDTKAAPVLVSQKNLIKSGNNTAGILINSGNANAATGTQGIKDTQYLLNELAKILSCETHNLLMCSTGLIGIPLDTSLIAQSLKTLVNSLSFSDKAYEMAANAILTTDTFPKVVTKKLGEVTITAFAKGAAMISPSMATMLCFVLTDADLEIEDMKSCLTDAVENTFNNLIIDGCMSTNDTVMLLSSNKVKGVSQSEFYGAISSILDEIAVLMAKDAEGSTKFVQLTVKGAVSLDQAKKCARQVANSLLVKCSLFGCDPYWGRILSELGAAQAGINPDLVDIYYGPFLACKKGVANHPDKDKLVDYMKKSELSITCDLNLGNHESKVYMTDLGYGYIDENKTTS
jgi:glutamate N-acetyltransferase/amino-acid N-acetyltransferase